MMPCATIKCKRGFKFGLWENVISYNRDDFLIIDQFIKDVIDWLIQFKSRL